MNIIIKSKKMLTCLLMQQIICGTELQSTQKEADEWEINLDKATEKLLNLITEGVSAWHRELDGKLETVVLLASGNVR